MIEPHPRWRVTLAVTPYVVLGALIAFTLVVEWGEWSRAVPTLALCALAIVWVLVLRDLPLPWRGRPAAVGLLLAGLIVLNLLLVLREGWFGFLTIATFTIAYSRVAWPWELLPVGCTAVVAGLAQSSGIGHDRAGVLATVAVVALNVAVMCGLSWGLRLSRLQIERAAVADERGRLARDIHDTLAQGFAGIITQLQASEQAPDEAARTRHTAAALALAREGLDEARRSVQALRPAALDAVRLPEALGNVARTWSARTGIPVELVESGTGRPLPLEAEVALLRTAQEALANVEQHADARHVTLGLRASAHRIRLEVRDDGRGFDTGARSADRSEPRGDAAPGGYGLVAMRERIESVSGAFAVESRPGRGTAVRAEVPA